MKIKANDWVVFTRPYLKNQNLEIRHKVLSVHETKDGPAVQLHDYLCTTCGFKTAWPLLGINWFKKVKG